MCCGREFLVAPGDDPVELVPYDDRWPAQFSVWRSLIADALGDVAIGIEHIGSTSVPGLAAKPVIDIDVTVGDLEDEATYRPVLEKVGLILAIRRPEERYFRHDVAGGAGRRVHVHVCAYGSRWARDDLLFRDYLRDHPERRAAYAALKQELAAQFRNDRNGYTQAKTEFVAQTVRLATE